MAVLLLAALSLASAQQPQPAPAPAPRQYSRPFVSPMGEPYEGKDALDQWFRQADGNADGSVSQVEMQADAARFFVSLDTTKDGEIDPDDVRRYETVVAPFIHVGSGGPVARARYDPADDQHAASHHHGEDASGTGSTSTDGSDNKNVQPSDPKVVLPARQGAGWFGLLNIAEPITAADTNFDRGVSSAEFDRAAAKRFQVLDSNHDGLLSLPELRAFLPR